MGATDEEITLDIVSCGGYGLTPFSENVGTTIENYHASKDIKKFYTTSNSVTEELRSAPNINLRYYF